MKTIAALAALLVSVSAASAQETAASDHGFAAYNAAEACMRAYGQRFAPTAASPQDVADAALQACFSKRYAAAAEKAQRYGAPAGSTANTQPDEQSLRRATIMALLEARYPKAR